jgi:hypothetical protein
MPRETPPVEVLRDAVEKLTAEDLIRLQLVARVFDPRVGMKTFYRKQ